MRVVIETNFSFPNLLKKYKKIKKKMDTGVYNAAAKPARELLKKGKVLPPLTKKSRSKGEFAKYGKKPLYKTRALYKSIKGNTKGLHMLEYGKMHNDGFGKNTQREFIKIDGEEQNRLTEELLNAIDKALGTGSVINFPKVKKKKS